jgi:hypothetical protein
MSTCTNCGKEINVMGRARDGTLHPCTNTSIDLYDALKNLLLCPDLDIDLDKMDPETIQAKEQARKALAKAVQ